MCTSEMEKNSTKRKSGSHKKSPEGKIEKKPKVSKLKNLSSSFETFFYFLKNK